MSNSFGMQFGGNSGGTATGGNPARPHTQGQVQMYMKLCRQKGVVPESLFGKSYDEVYAMNDALYALDPPATPAQLNTILEITEKLMKIIPAEHHHRLFEQTDMVKLNINTASTRIAELKDLERRSREYLPISEQQHEQIMQMYLCPDVNYEYIDIPNRIDLGYKMKRKDGTEVDAWRLLTPDELSAMLSKKTAQEANDFIYNYRDAYKEWKKTRMSEATYNTIRTLEKQMADLSGAGVELTQASDLEGNPYTIAITQNADRTRFNTMIGYEPMSDWSLQQLSQTEAMKHIEMLRSEIYRSEQFKRESDELNPQIQMEDIRTQAGLRSASWKSMNDMMYRVFSATNHTDETVIQYVLDLCDGSLTDEQEKKRKNHIRNYFRYCISKKWISTQALIIMIEDEKELLDILIGV